MWCYVFGINTIPAKSEVKSFLKRPQNKVINDQFFKIHRSPGMEFSIY